MSTRATIIVMDSENNRKQFYHHHDGYPEYMGECLKSFMQSALFLACGKSTFGERPKKRDEIFYELLKNEGEFELEENGDIHGDTEYCWYVDLNKQGEDDKLTYLKYSWGDDRELEHARAVDLTVGDTEYFKM